MAKHSFTKDFTRHPLQYFVLLCLEILGLWGIFWFSYQPTAQFALVVYMALAYVGWGVYHHQSIRDLHVKIIFEYILIALLSVMLLGSLLIQNEIPNFLSH